MAQGIHPSTSPYMFYDEHVKLEANGAIRRVFVDQTMTIQDFKAGNDMTHTLDRTSQDASFRLLLPGESSSARHCVACEVSKKFGRSLLKGLKQIELDGKCIDGFALNQIRVQASGKVKLRVTLLSSAHLTPAQCLAHLRTNYGIARQAIEFLFMDGNGIPNVPDDVRHLLTLMLNHFADRDLFRDHASLTPLNKAGDLLKDLLDRLKGIDWPQYRNICLDVASDFANARVDWRRSVADNDLLHCTYIFNKKTLGSEYLVPPNWLNNNQITPDQQAALRAVHLNRYHQGPLTNQEYLIIDGHKVLTYMRNRHAHQMEAITNTGLGRFGFKLAHSELVSLCKFQKVLSIVQIHLFRMRNLNDPNLL